MKSPFAGGIEGETVSGCRYMYDRLAFYSADSRAGVIPLFAIHTESMIQRRSTVPTKGRKAIVRARLIAWVSVRWCLAQQPDNRRGMILPRSVMKYLRDLGSL